ncbi:MAG: hypothetical protein M5R40_12550 [Anaerolineae bacterium]|nr:hypothetical protein [Anaerolineae bacterium]
MLPPYATFADLPLSGSIDVTIPDAPGVRRVSWGDFWLYIIEDGVFPPAPDSSTTVVYDRDGNLDCDTQLTVGENDFAGPEAAVPGTPVSITWDSCGNENTLIRLALVVGDFGSPPVSEEFIPVDPFGTMTVNLPDEAGMFYIQLYYEHAGERYMLLSSPLILGEAQE